MQLRIRHFPNFEEAFDHIRLRGSVHSCPAALTFQTSKHSQSCNYHERERGKLYSIREASVANNVWQGRRHASERKGSLCAAAVLLLPHGDYDTRQQTRSTLQRQRQIGNWDAFSLDTAARSSHYVSGFVSKPPADGFHPEMVTRIVCLICI